MSKAQHHGDKSAVEAFAESELVRKWWQLNVEPPENDMLIGVTASSKTPVSGSGKTTIITWLGKLFDRTPDGFDGDEKGTVDAGELANDIIPEVPTKSAVCYAEAQGLPGSDSVNARRGMTNEALAAINGILGNRDKNLTVILDAQQLWMLDKSFYPMLDAWIMITKAPGQPGGPKAVHHDIYINDYDLGKPQIKTPIVESLEWPKIPENDPDYVALEEKKVEAKKKSQSGGNEETGYSDDVQADIAQEFRNIGKSPRWIEENIEAVEYSYSWIYDHTNTPDDKEDGENA